MILLRVRPKLFRTLRIILALIVIGGSLWLAFTSEVAKQENLHAHQAKAFLEGRLDIPRNYHDVANYNGRFYVAFPPFPAIVLLPVVAVFGTSSAKVVFVSIFLTMLNIFLLTRILKKLDIDRKFIPWVAAAFFLGTGYWLSVCWSFGVWFFSHIVAITCMLLAINEVLGKGRGFLVGLFLGMAFLSRHLCIYSAFFLIAALLENTSTESRKGKLGNIFGFMITVAVCIGIYLVFNKARFGSIFDTGYAYLSTGGFLKARVERFGLFNPIYLPFNFINMFIQGFRVEFGQPVYLNVAGTHPMGTSITFASPFVFFAFWANWKKRLLGAAWFSVAVSIIHWLLYYNNGWVQLNTQRFSLDFFPILILLAALGMRRVPDVVWKSAVIYSVALNTLALFLVPLLERFMRF